MLDTLSRRRTLLMFTACLFIGVVGLYSVLWIRATHARPTASFGLRDYDYLGSGDVRVLSVAPGSPADRAGLSKDDRLLSVEAQPISLEILSKLVLRGQPGEKVELVVRRATALAPQTMAVVLNEGRASAALAASLFHFGEIRIAEAKARLRAAGVEVRIA